VPVRVRPRAPCKEWYESGKLLNKKNTFTDFLDVAEYLVQNKYTSSKKLFATGGSAGGLLMGAVANLQENLFRGIIMVVPFVDVMTTMQDPDLPLTTNEYSEWGNPADEKFYRYILSYSPYDNIKKLDYPAMLVLTGFADSQVQYWEPAKWVAKLRTHKTYNNRLFFFTDFETGHSGTTGRFAQYKLTAKEYAFLLDILADKP